MLVEKATKLFSHFHVKIAASVTKNSQQKCDPRYLHLLVFYFLYLHSPLLSGNKKMVRSLLSSEN